MDSYEDALRFTQCGTSGCIRESTPKPTDYETIDDELEWLSSILTLPQIQGETPAERLKRYEMALLKKQSAERLKRYLMRLEKQRRLKRTILKKVLPIVVIFGVVMLVAIV